VLFRSVRGWELLGRSWDITLEATVAGLLAGFRVIVVIAAFGLLSAAVDPDGLLKLFRRLSYRSALTAALATRLVPVIARDAARMTDAARCRPESPGRLAVTRAAVTGALDRATEVAAALEVRGYALASKPAAARMPWSRHDVSVALAAALIAAAALAGRVAGVGEVGLYPAISLPAGPPELALGLALPLVACVPLLGRSARLGVAHA
jgi:energy-coupling factor transport system permease protein